MYKSAIISISIIIIIILLSYVFISLPPEYDRQLLFIIFNICVLMVYKYTTVYVETFGGEEILASLLKNAELKDKITNLLREIDNVKAKLAQNNAQEIYDNNKIQIPIMQTTPDIKESNNSTNKNTNNNDNLKNLINKLTTQGIKLNV